MISKKKETCLSVWLAIFVIATIGLLIGLLVYIFVIKEDSTCKPEDCGKMKPEDCGKMKPEVCMSKECVISAGLFLNSMNSSQSPCTDFYEFVCGRYAENNPIPDHSVSIDSFGHLNNKVSNALKDLLEEEANDDDEAWKKKVKNFYDRCMEFGQMNELGVNTLKEFVNWLGKWPLVEGINWISSPKGLEVLLGKLLRYGLSSEFVKIELLPDNYSPNVTKIVIEQPFESVFVVKSYWRRTKISDFLSSLDNDDIEYIKLIQGFVRMLGRQDVGKIVPEIVEMSLVKEELQKISVDRNDRKDLMALYKKMTVRQLNDLTDRRIDWLTIFQTMFDGTATITEDEEVVVAGQEFLRKLPRIVTAYSKRAITNYIMWEAISSLIAYMPSDGILLFDVFKQQTEGIAPTPRWSHCVDQTVEVFEWAVSRMYVDKYVDRNINKITEVLIKVHMEAYRKMITDCEWLDKQTKDAALRKFETIRINVGYPDSIHNDTTLNEIYENINVTENHFQNILDDKLTSALEEFDSYYDTIDKDEWTTEILTANAFYEPNINSINFPVVILSPPYLEQNNIVALNYGALGSVIGHEIGHAFDNDGSFYDHNGALSQWWTNATREIYENKTKCFVEQYSNYCPEEFIDDEGEENCVDGVNTLGENIADDTGLKSSYYSYKQWLEKNGPEKRLPGLEEYNEEQLFFISHAYTNCENIGVKHYATVYEDEEHAPNKYRVLGVVQNFDKFQEVFKCQKPEEVSACNIW